MGKKKFKFLKIEIKFMVLFGGALLLILAFGIDSSASQPAEKQSYQKVLNIQRPNGCQYDNGSKTQKTETNILQAPIKVPAKVAINR